MHKFKKLEESITKCACGEYFENGIGGVNGVCNDCLDRAAKQRANAHEEQEIDHDTKA